MLLITRLPVLPRLKMSWVCSIGLHGGVTTHPGLFLTSESRRTLLSAPVSNHTVMALTPVPSTTNPSITIQSASNRTIWFVPLPGARIAPYWLAEISVNGFPLVPDGHVESVSL